LRSSASATAATDGAAAASVTQPQTLVNRTQYRPTDFLEKLKHYQKEIYIHLRANLGTHLDATAEAELTNFIDREQATIVTDLGDDLTDANFFDKDNRVKWSDMKTFILSLCKAPLEGDRFIKLRTVKRKDNTTLTLWANAVRDIKRDIDKMGAHWKLITGRESMAITARWMTDIEKNLMDQLMATEGVKGTYPTFDDLTDKMGIDEFLEYCSKLDPRKVPKSFKRWKSKEALKLTLLTHAQAERMVTEKTKALQDKVERTEAALAEANNT
jgi:hypothetical protein